MLSNDLQSIIWNLLRRIQPFDESLSMVYWFQTLSMNTNDADRSGYPNEAAIQESIKQVLKIVKDDGKVNVREIAEILWSPLSHALGYLYIDWKYFHYFA